MQFRVPPFVYQKELEGALREAALIVLPAEVLTLAVYGFLLSAIFSITVLNLLPSSSLITFSAAALPVMVALGAIYYPFLRRKTVRMQIIGEAPLAILYTIISLRTAPSLENALAFAAANVPDPIGKQFKILMWEVTLRKHLDMAAALAVYSQEVKPWAPGFSDALYLISNSVNEPTDELRIRSLDKAITVALDSTRTQMEQYARNLSMPVAAVNALGILLPVIGLVLAPVASVFIGKGASVSAMLVVVYDFFLPLSIIALVMTIMASRPGSFSKISVEEHPDLPPWGFYNVTVNGRKVRVSLAGVSLAIFLSFTFLTFLGVLASGPEIFLPKVGPQSNGASSLLTLPLIAGTGIAIGLYYYANAMQRVKMRDDVKEMEREFASSLFQLGNILDQGKPMEQAFEEMVKEMKGTRSAEFFRQTAYNVRSMGLPLQQAIFDERVGAIHSFPSYLIKNVMAVVVKSSEEGPRVAAATSVSTSNYIKNLYAVQEKIEDALSDSVTSMKFQANVLIPLVGGVVVGLTQMISGIVVTIARQVDLVFSGSTLEGYSSSFLSTTLNLEGIMQPSFLQMVVGFYTIVLLATLGYFAGGLEFGKEDRIGIYYVMGKTLLIGSLMYFAVTAVVSLVFGTLAAAVTATL